jgi:hypothetical protein
MQTDSVLCCSIAFKGILNLFLNSIQGIHTHTHTHTHEIVLPIMPRITEMCSARGIQSSDNTASAYSIPTECENCNKKRLPSYKQKETQDLPMPTISTQL